jgi:quercetin dioxygenase-like cupin family protein
MSTTDAETPGSFALWEPVVPPGAGAPPHTDAREDEAFCVLSGELLIEIEGEPRSIALRSAVSSMVRGRRHAFRNAGDKPARVLILSAPRRCVESVNATRFEGTTLLSHTQSSLNAYCRRHCTL